MSKIATLVGCAIGDSLGNPFEMKPAISPVFASWQDDFIDGGTFWVGKAGQYTDDTLMSLALTKSLLQCQGFNPADVAKEYLAWYNSGNTRGIGGTTASAMMRLKLGASHLESGIILNPDGSAVGGNGTAMRAAPLGIAYRNDLFKCMKYSQQDAIITHNSLEPKMGSMAIALGNALLATGSDPTLVLESVTEVVNDSYVKEKLRLVAKHLNEGTDPVLALADIGTNGYVPETVAAAYYCLLANDNFKDTVIMAVRGGGDTDTTAAIAGAMAGTFYGLDGIPSEYKDKVENFEILTLLDDELVNIEI